MRVALDGTAAYAYTGTRALDRAQPSLVLLHGGEQDHSVWTLHARWFAHHGWNAVTPDLPGHGRSAGAPLASIAAMADWIIRLLDALALDDAVLVGHSMGSLVAIDAAARHPARVRAIALVGCTVPMTLDSSVANPFRR